MAKTIDDVLATILGADAPLRNSPGFTLEMLEKEGLEIDAQSSTGETVLMRAVTCGHIPLVKKALEKFADPRIKNNAGNNAIDLAVGKFKEAYNTSNAGLMSVMKDAISSFAEHGHVKLIAQAGEKTNLPLFSSIVMGNLNVVKYLVKELESKGKLETDDVYVDLGIDFGFRMAKSKEEINKMFEIRNFFQEFKRGKKPDAKSVASAGAGEFKSVMPEEGVRASGGILGRIFGGAGGKSK